MIRLRRPFRGARRYSIAAAAIVCLIFILGFYTQKTISARKQNQDAVTEQLNAETAQEIQRQFEKREQLLLKTHAQFVQELTAQAARGKNYAALYVSQLEKDNFCYEVLTKDSILYWAGDAPVNRSSTIPYTNGQFFFFRTPTTVYGAAANQIIANNDTLLLITGLLFENKAVQTAALQTTESFQLDLEDAFVTEIIPDYTPYKTTTRDLRYKTVALKNRTGATVGGITFKKHGIDANIEHFVSTMANIQGLLIVAGFILIGFAVSGDFKALRFPLLKPVLFTVYFIVFRLLLFKLNFPASLFSGELIEPAGFASQLGGGIVKSPIEFFITTAFFFICAVYVYWRYSSRIDHYKPHIIKRAGYIFYGSIPLYLLGLFLAIRGIAASVKSVINDSTFRYFNEPVIIPPLPQLIMVTGVLILVTAVLLLLSLIFKAHLRFVPLPLNSGVHWFIAMEFIISLALGAVFIKMQNDPLITYTMFAVLLILLHILFYIAVYRPMPLLNMVLITGLFSSASGVSLMNYFNSELERESLKTTITEINRPGIEFLRFLASEALSRSENNASLIEGFQSSSQNMSPEAYLLWNASALRQERVQSTLWILDRSKTVLGSFTTEDSLQQLPSWVHAATMNNELRTEVEHLSSQDSMVHISGLAPIVNNRVVLGYLAVAVSYKQGMQLTYTVSDLLKNAPAMINNILSPAEVNIFTIREGEAENIFGDFYPTLSQTESLQAGISKGEGETWADFVFNNEKYVVFAQNAADGKPGSIIAVALKEKNLEWSFFNFFKLFTLHIFLILIIAAGSALITIFRRGSLLVTFRMQLLTAFLLVSILPVIALAIFNRYATYEKSRLSMRAALQANMAGVEKLAVQMLSSIPDDRAAQLIRQRTGVYCNFYKDNVLTGSALPSLFHAGIQPALLTAGPDYHMNYAGLKEFFTENLFGDRVYFSLYKKVKIAGQPYIIETNSLFNQIAGQYSPVEVDVFLFGIYSLAILMVIGLSSIITNRIAMPVKLLTMATRSVAHGDLNVKLDNNSYGEMRELINGFNTMTDELQRNQAELANLEREAAWKEFARQVAHEVKNPLTPMKLTMQQLVAAYHDKSPKFDAIFEKVSATILHQIETLNAIASEFSSFARMPVMNIEKIDIIPIIHESITLFQNEKIAISLAGEVPDKLELLGDTSHFRRMFINFFRNSIQAGAGKIEVSIGIHDTIRLSIADDGHGIEQSNEQKIFEQNFTTKAGGMGLGLKLSRRFIESLGGTITLLPQDKGACFIIELPKA